MKRMYKKYYFIVCTLFLINGVISVINGTTLLMILSQFGAASIFLYLGLKAN